MFIYAKKQNLCAFAYIYHNFLRSVISQRINFRANAIRGMHARTLCDSRVISITDERCHISSFFIFILLIYIYIITLIIADSVRILLCIYQCTKKRVLHRVTSVIVAFTGFSSCHEENRAIRNEWNNLNKAVRYLQRNSDCYND